MKNVRDVASAPSRFLGCFARKIAVHAILTLQRNQYENVLSVLPEIRGPALVVGSAPEPTRPKNITPEWFKISINASQYVLELFELGKPNLTIFQPKIKFADELRQAYWKVLANKGTDHLIFAVNSKSDGQISEFLQQKAYFADQISYIEERFKNAIVKDVLGSSVIGAMPNDRSISNGMFAAVLALKLGAEKVVMSGFSMSGGWSFTDGFPQQRKHQRMDKWACRLLVENGLPVFTSDIAFSHATGIPLWEAKAGSFQELKNPFQRSSK